MITQHNFYLNDEKITDDFIIKELRKEKNKSALIKSLLWNYYKELAPFAKTQEASTEELTKERT